MVGQGRLRLRARGSHHWSMSGLGTTDCDEWRQILSDRKEVVCRYQPSHNAGF
jgi:hypothetical protein